MCLLLAVITLALYNPVNRYPFVNYDDDRYVTENAHMRQGLTWDTFTWALTSTEQANWHPLTWLSHAIDISLFRLNPAGHHFTSLFLHIVNVILLFLLLVWATGRTGPSLFVAVLFAVHPINVESVAWVAERKNVLCTMFFLLTLGAYGWYVRKPDWQRYLAVILLFAAALASKPMAVTLPFVLLLLDYWPLGRMRGAKFSSAIDVSLSRLVLEKLPLFALSAVSAYITMQAQQAGGSVRSIAEFSFAVRLQTAIYAYGMYLWKMFWPARLAPLYPHPGDSLALWQIATAALVLVAISILAFRFRSHGYMLVGWLWFLGTLVPVIGLVQVGDAAMADRYAYIPLIGIFVMVTFGMADIAVAKSVGIVWQIVPVTVLLIAVAFATNRQIGYWRSNEDLWSHALQVTKNNFIAEDNLGGALILEDKEEEAFPHFQAAARINPRDSMSHSNLGSYLLTHGRTPEAIAQFQQAIELTSDPRMLAMTNANLGLARQALGEDDAAQQNFDEALRINPSQFNAWLGLGLLMEKRGKLDEAINDIFHSLELQPTGEGYLQLGRALQQAGRRAEALAAYQQALKLSPDLTEAQQGAAALSNQH